MVLPTVSTENDSPSIILILKTLLLRHFRPKLISKGLTLIGMKQMNNGVKGVGGAQKLLPMHVVYEYCSNRPFYPLPDFTQQLALPASKRFQNCGSARNEDWFAVGSNLGVHFAIRKLPLFHGAQAPNPQVWRMQTGILAADLAAMKALCEARTKDFINLESQLAALAVVDEEPGPTPPQT